MEAGVNQGCPLKGGLQPAHSDLSRAKSSDVQSEKQTGRKPSLMSPTSNYNSQSVHFTKGVIPHTYYFHTWTHDPHHPDHKLTHFMISTTRQLASESQDGSISPFSSLSPSYSAPNVSPEPHLTLTINPLPIPNDSTPNLFSISPSQSLQCP